MPPRAVSLQELPIASTRRLAAVAAATSAVAALAYAAGCTWVFLQLDPAPMEALEPVPGLASLSVETCAPCHVEITAEWRSSRMARATTGRMFRTDFAAKGEQPICLRCHAPLPAQQPTREHGLLSVVPLIALETPNPDFDPALGDEGVTCVVCHLRDGAMEGPRSDIVGAPHPVRAVPDMDDVCARCHQLPEPPLSGLDRPLSDTHGEYATYRSLGGTETCASCHMPPVTRSVALGGPVRTSRRHNFPGGWDDELVRSAISVEAVSRVDGGVEVVLRNLAGHGVPTSEPARALVVRATAEGVHAEAVLARRIPMPRLRDLGDTSLRPGETRSVRLEVPPGPVQVLVRFERLRFNAPLAEAVGLSEHRLHVLIHAEDLP